MPGGVSKLSWTIERKGVDIVVSPKGSGIYIESFEQRDEIYIQNKVHGDIEGMFSLGFTEDDAKYRYHYDSGLWDGCD